MHFFHPSAEVPEEEERHKHAEEIREMKASELRAQLQTDPLLHEKIDGITALLSEHAKT